MKMTYIVLITGILVMAFTGATQMSQKKIVPSKEKWTQFECGFSNMNPSHLPFSFQFFLVAILFLIFDVEISMVLSYPMESQSIKTSMVIFLFLLILTLGLIYEWQKSKIDWSKWMS